MKLRNAIYPAVIAIFGLFFAYKSGFFSSRKEYKEEEKIFVMDEYYWNEMIEKIKETALRYPGKTAIYIKDFNTKREWSYKADSKFPSASLVKVPIMASVFSIAVRDGIDLNKEIPLTKKDRRAGSGTLKWAREGTRISLMEIIYKMITESDNTAAQMLIDYFGMENLQKEFLRLGLLITNINESGMSLSSNPVKEENYTTAREISGLFEKIYEGRLINKNASRTMMEILKRTKGKSRLRKGLPREWEIGHKTGLLRKACHDAGIVFSPGGDYLVIVLTAEVPSYKSGKDFISKIAKITSAYYKNEPALAGGVR
ncbi:MAG: serine hydrolase [Elusimicrobia bacterium]|nr:serine hydrolase [Elusimicrobiota bacterium]